MIAKVAPNLWSLVRESAVFTVLMDLPPVRQRKKTRRTVLAKSII